MPEAIYDTIGVNYADLRRPDPRIAALIDGALGDAQTVLNVGAGAGSYEPAQRIVTALEPSAAMIAQRPAGAARAVQGVAEVLPFPDRSFDAAMAILSVHHWADQPQGLRELRRVARGAVAVLTFDPQARPWLTDYLPELAALDEAQMPAMPNYARHLGPVDIKPVPVPRDCSDGFLYAYWARPAAYLDPRIRTGSSSFWKLPAAQAGLAQLDADLRSGAWQGRYGHLLEQDALDLGYRLVVTR